MLLKITLLAVPFLLYIAGMTSALNGWAVAETVTKVLATVILAGAVIFLAEVPLGVRLAFGIAFLLAAVGDGTLAYQKYLTPGSSLQGLLFIIGLGSFLVAYLTYSTTTFAVHSEVIFHPATILTFAIFAGISTWQFFSFPNLSEEMTVPVIAYLVQATLLVAAAAVAVVAIPGWPGILFAVAAVSLYVSDSLIGWNIFGLAPLPLGGEPFILPTYIIGQVGIGAVLLFSNFGIK